jgi:hypothetical protein
LTDLEALVEPLTRGDPQSPLRWTCKSTAKLAAELNARGHVVSPRTINTLLARLGYSLQSDRKAREGGTLRRPRFDGSPPWNCCLLKDFEPPVRFGFSHDTERVARRLEVIAAYRPQLAEAIRTFLPGSFFPTCPSAATPTGPPGA